MSLAALACPMCFSQAANSPMVDAAFIGIVALFAITVGVLGGVAAFIRHLVKLSRRADTQPDLPVISGDGGQS